MFSSIESEKVHTNQVTFAYGIFSIFISLSIGCYATPINHPEYI